MKTFDEFAREHGGYMESGTYKSVVVTLDLYNSIQLDAMQNPGKLVSLNSEGKPISTMTPERYKSLTDGTAMMINLELSKGWHFCDCNDRKLVGPGMRELITCCCKCPSHPVYKTTPSRDENI